MTFKFKKEEVFTWEGSQTGSIPFEVKIPAICNPKRDDEVVIEGVQGIYQIKGMTAEIDRDVMICKIKKIEPEDLKKFVSLKIDGAEIELKDKDGVGIPATAVDLKLRPGELPDIQVSFDWVDMEMTGQACFQFSDEALAVLAEKAGYKLEPIDVNLKTELGEEEEIEEGTDPLKWPGAEIVKWPENVKWEEGVNPIIGEKATDIIVFDEFGDPIDANTSEELPSTQSGSAHDQRVHSRDREEQHREDEPDPSDGSGSVRETRGSFRKGRPRSQLRKHRK